LGIPYFGPIDGHDIPALIELLDNFKEVNHPVLLHVQTEKGRGFTPAHQDPCTFHSPQPFKVNGETAQFTAGDGKSFTSAFADALIDLMESDQRVVALTAAMADGTGLVKVRQKFPERVIDVGIAESGAVDIAAGLAKTGMRPVVAIYSTFLQRSFDQIFQEVSLQNLPVIFCLDRAGMVGGDGAVHHGFCDITLLRSLPNLVLMAPMDEEELIAALKFALQSSKPCVLRYPRDLLPEKHSCLGSSACEPFELGQARKLRPGKDAVALAYGGVLPDVLDAADILARQNIQLGVINARFAKPLDEQLLHELLGDEQDFPVFTIEDHALAGGFGSAVLETAQQLQLNTRRIIRLGMPDKFIKQDSRRRQLAQVGIDAQGIAQKVSETLSRRPTMRQ
jgi:1-deoxy-D-xylulose-5-phosphate synthase